MFQRNVGGLDRVGRLALGMMLLIVGVCLLVLLQGHPISVVVAAVGLFLIVTGALGFCPFYVPLGRSTVGKLSAFGGWMERMMAACPCGAMMKEMCVPHFGETAGADAPAPVEPEQGA